MKAIFYKQGQTSLIDAKIAISKDYFTINKKDGLPIFIQEKGRMS